MEIDKLEPLRKYVNVSEEEICLKMTGLKLINIFEVRDKVNEDHSFFHNKYDLPDDNLLIYRKQKEYFYQIMEKIDKRNVSVNFNNTLSPTCYKPDVCKFTTFPIKRTWRGEIAINPKEVNLNDGLLVGVALAHEFIHAQQPKSQTIDEVIKSEYEAYIGSEPIDVRTHSYINRMFNCIVKSVELRFN